MPPAPSVLRQNLLPSVLGPVLKRNKFDGSVVVQATTQLEETHWLLDLADENEFIAGVVGWVDLTDPGLGGTLDELQRRRKFKGVRHPVHDESDTEWLMRPAVVAGLRELARRGLPYDLLLRPLHLPLVVRLAEMVPELRMVIDHLAKPRIAEGVLEGWAGEMERIAAIAQVFVKISGMITEDGPGQWIAARIRPYVQHVLRLFGPNRVMFGSDWPVCLLAGRWKETLAAFTQSVGAQTEEAREKMLGGTAVKFYGL